MSMKHYIGIDCGKSSAVCEIDNAGNLLDSTQFQLGTYMALAKSDIQQLKDKLTYG